MVEIFCRNVCVVQEGRREVVRYRVFTVITTAVGVGAVYSTVCGCADPQ